MNDMMDVGYVKDRFGSVNVFRKAVPNTRGAMAIELVTRWGLVAAKPDGEDTAGRSKLALLSPVELVDRAVVTADLAIAELERRGWFLELPEPTLDK